MSRYRVNNNPYRGYALIAGFVEIGESFEETIHREVMEEVGLKVKNIRYYKSQPWAFSDTEMIGFLRSLMDRIRSSFRRMSSLRPVGITAMRSQMRPMMNSIGSELKMVESQSSIGRPGITIMN